MPGLVHSDYSPISKSPYIACVVVPSAKSHKRVFLFPSDHRSRTVDNWANGSHESPMWTGLKGRSIIHILLFRYESAAHAMPASHTLGVHLEGAPYAAEVSVPVRHLQVGGWWEGTLR